jgi:segregation and condensation protein A
VSAHNRAALAVSDEPIALAESAAPPSPEVVDQVALARLYGEPLFKLPQDLYIPPDALEVFLEAFEGPLDLLLYLIRGRTSTSSTSRWPT